MRPVVHRLLHGSLIVALTMSVGVLSGCGRTAQPTDDAGSGIVTEQLGPEGRAYRQDNTTPVGVVVWFHGMDSDGTEFAHDPRHRHFAEPFLRNGWVIASATAGGNSFGNDAAVADYRRLIERAETEYRTTRLLFAGESMGVLAALRLYAEPTYAGIDGLVGVSPLTGLPSTIRTVDFIAGAWDGRVPQRADPLSAAASSYAGRRFLFFYSTGDTVVPAGAGARAFAIRFHAAATVTVVTCRGDHVDPSCYGGDAALAFADHAD